MQLRGELRPQAGALEGATEAALVVTSGGVVEREQVLHGDDLALHADDFADRGHPARAVLHTSLLDDHVDGSGDLFADGAHGQVDAGHQHHGLETGQAVAGTVRVNRGERAVVTGVHRLQHVQGGAVTTLTDDDPVGPHAQRVLDELTDVDLSAALDVGRSRLETQHVVLLELELGRVLDGDDALVVGDEGGHHVEQGRLARAGTTGDDDVAATTDAGAQEVTDLRRERAERNEVLVRERVGGELADGEQGAVERDGRDDRVDTRAVGQPGVHERAGLVDATADATDDLVDRAAEVSV